MRAERLESAEEVPDMAKEKLYILWANADLMTSE